MKTIICHAFPAWDAPYVKSTVELMTRLAKDHRVIYIDYHYTWKDIFKNPDCPKDHVLGKKSRWRTITTYHGTLEVYSTPPIIPMNWISNKPMFKVVAKINGWWIRRHLSKAFRKVNNSETTLINALNPIWGVMTSKVWKVKQQVYYCYDELNGTPWSNKWGPEYERQYLNQVDKVICTSTQLQATKSEFNADCHVVKNGVNLEIFKNPALEKSGSNTIGYIGAVDDRIDFELVRTMATVFRNYQFHFYGPIKTDIPDNLPKNVLFFGPKAQIELPQLIKNLDACIIPFVKNELTAAIYPLKINEYLAMGKPVVTTNFSDLSDFEELVSIADEHVSFGLFLKREITGNNRLRIQKRIDFAKENSWDARVQELIFVLD